MDHRVTGDAARGSDPVPTHAAGRGVAGVPVAAIAVVMGLVGAAVASPHPGQRLAGFHVREAFSDREDGWNDHGAEIWFAAGAFRLDLWSHGDREATRGSLILPPQDRSEAFLIHHFARQFDRCALETFAPVQGGPLGSWPFDPAVDRYEILPLDDVRQVASWSTAAVSVREPGPDEEWISVPGNPRARQRRTYDRAVGRLWLTDDTGIAPEELRRTLAESLRPYADAGVSWILLHSMWLHTVLGLDPDRLPGLPAGIPVAVEYQRLGELGMTGELRSIGRARLPASLFEIPAGYTRANLCPGG